MGRSSFGTQFAMERATFRNCYARISPLSWPSTAAWSTIANASKNVCATANASTWTAMRSARHCSSRAPSRPCFRQASSGFTTDRSSSCRSPPTKSRKIAMTCRRLRAPIPRDVSPESTSSPSGARSGSSTDAPKDWKPQRSNGWSRSMPKVEAISFLNRDGLRLYGTLHTPGEPNRTLPAVILLSPGVKMRVGPGRLYVPLTELLTSLGYTVLRFDFFGLGDSEGDLSEVMLADVYNHIEVGRYVEDTLCAIEWLATTHGFKRFMLGGLCGGAVTAVLAAQRDSRVESLLSLGMNVTLSSNAVTPAKYLTRAELDSRRQKYFRRLLEPKSWWRFLTFQSEYGVIWRSMLRMFVRDKPAAQQPVSEEQRGNANPLFPPAYLAFLARGGRALLVFAEKDRLYSEYEEKFVAFYREQLEPYQLQIRQHIIPYANHVLTFHEWQREMLEHCRAWLQLPEIRHGSPA
nr:hypothetical protein [Gammaproteobacteria bacterium]